MNFQTWLKNTGKSPRSAKSYSGAISGVMSDWATQAGLVNESILEITSPKQLEAIAEKLSQVDIFVARNTKGNGMYSAAMNAYLDYLNDCSSEVLEEDLKQIIRDPKIKATEKSTLINARIGQGKYRKGLIDYWNSCAVTGFSDTRFLVASHIKPWKDPDNSERLDAFNGLLLLPNIDKAFDLGYISFKQQGDILISPELQCTDALGVNQSMSINLDARRQLYMEHHRDSVFKG